MDNTRWLSFVLDEDMLFEDLLTKFEKIFKIKLTYKDDEGRYIATGHFFNCDFNIIDREDRLHEILNDEHHVIEFIISDDNYFNREFEKKIEDFFSINNVRWIRVVWAPEDLPTS